MNRKWRRRLLMTAVTLLGAAACATSDPWAALAPRERSRFATCQKVAPLCEDVSNAERGPCLRRAKAHYGRLADDTERTKWLVEGGCPFRVIDPEVYVGAGESPEAPPPVPPSR